MSELREFEYVLERQADGGFLIYIPKLPGLASEGATREGRSRCFAMRFPVTSRA